MGDKCEVNWCKPTARELLKLAKKDRAGIARLQAHIGHVEDFGWDISTKSELIKVLKEDTRIGEIRDMGKGGYRAFFYWEETETSHEIHITAIPKKNTLTPKRVNEFIKAAENRRQLDAAGGNTDEDTEEDDQ
jgi:hypothetical protein